MKNKEPAVWEVIQDRDEAAAIRRRRRVAFGFADATNDLDCPDSERPPEVEAVGKPQDLFGLALSGGGIRSALFNDGFLQALSHRGLLRFVDYLSSVSGGGYIAGHLVASGVERKRLRAPESFHDAPPCFEMGRDPMTGRLALGRIEDAGGYLSHKMEFWLYFVASWVLTAALYIGVVGVAASLIALVWRSFDNPYYRESIALLGFNTGGELLYAYLPCMLFLALWVLWALVRCVLLYVPGSLSILAQRWLWVNRALGLVTILSALIGIAVFLGNEWTSIGDGPDLYLNHIAQWLAAAAAAMQVVAFMWRDRLFRSERPQASNWQRLTQKVLTYVVVATAVFAMVHWMSRENIAGYVEHRDNDLVVADIADWPAFLVACDEHLVGVPKPLLKSEKNTLRSTRYWADTRSKSAGSSEWRRFQRRQWLASEKTQTEANPRSGDWAWDVSGTGADSLTATQRVGCLMKLSLAAVSGNLGGGPGAPGSINFDWFSGELEGQLKVMQQKWEYRSELLSKFNHHVLGSRELAAILLVSVCDSLTDSVRVREAYHAVPIQLDVLEEVFENKTDELDKWIAARKEPHGGWSAGKLARFQRDVQWFFGQGEGRLLVSAESIGKRTGTNRLERLNRDLFSLVHPGVLVPEGVCPTPMVFAHDQASRKRWLVFWGICAAIGFLANINLNQQSPLYRYYRRMLADKFLVGWVGPQSAGASSVKEDRLLRLSQCDVTHVGLPYPIMLGALLDPWRGRINRKPFLFTPKYVGVSDPVDGFATKSAEFTIPGNPGCVKLIDAVAISGSAVAPFMTRNLALQLVMGFFNVRLGQWVQLPRILSSFLVSRKIRFLGPLSVAREVFRGGEGARFGFVADGGFVDYLGVNELLKRRCRLILVTDSGSNIGGNQLGTLSSMLEDASGRLGVKFVDLDHESPIDFGRLLQDSEKNVPQPFLCMRIRYPDEQSDAAAADCLAGATPHGSAYLVYVQMAITDSDPIEIRQIRNRFPVFPDEPTVNQFYSEDQVAAYRQLGYHIGQRVCNELVRWSPLDISSALAHDVRCRLDPEAGSPVCHEQFFGADSCLWSEDISERLRREYVTGERLPLFDVIKRRMLAGYRMACFEETSYREGDIFSDAIWDRGEWCFASFCGEAQRLRRSIPSFDVLEEFNADLPQAMRNSCDTWLRVYEENADVRTAYRRAVFFDMNCSVVSSFKEESFIGYEVYRELSQAVLPRTADPTSRWSAQLGNRDLCVVAAHLAAIAMACHQMRRGTPSAIFQIGGRDKLIDLVMSMVQGDGYASEWRRWLRGAGPEIIELRRCVFQEAEIETTASFAYIMTMFVAKLATPDRTEPPAADAYMRLYETIKKDLVYQLPELLIEIFDGALPPPVDGRDSEAAISVVAPN